MSEVNSDPAVAHQLATDIFCSLDMLNTVTSVSKDTQTTILGNSNAQESIELATNIINQISGAIGNASNNLQSVANEFEAADQEIRKIMNPIS